MIALSVIVCANQPSELRGVLAALKAQSLPTSDWELLLVECTDNRKPAAHDLAWHAGSRIFLENVADPALLMRRAIEERKSDLLIVLDQNCELAPDYLSEALKTSRQWPRLGVWGSGAIDLKFQATSSQPVRDLAFQVARRNVGAHLFSNVLTCTEAAPLGPGLCIRATVAAAYCERPISPSEVHKADGDAFAHDLAAAELGYLACSTGLGMGVFPQLRLTRVIPGPADERQFLVYQERESILRALLYREWKDIRPADPLSAAALISTARSILLESGVRRRLRVAEFKAAMKARKILQAASVEHTR